MCEPNDDQDKREERREAQERTDAANEAEWIDAARDRRESRELRTLAQLGEQFDQISKLRSQLSDVHCTVRDLTADRDQAREQLEDYIHKLALALAERDHEKARADRHLENVESYQKLLHDHETDSEKTRRELAELRGLHSHLVEEHDSLSGRIAVLYAENQKLRSDFEALQRRPAIDVDALVKRIEEALDRALEKRLKEK